MPINRRFNVRVSEGEQDDIQRACEALKMSQAEFFRHTMLFLARAVNTNDKETIEATVALVAKRLELELLVNKDKT